MSMIVQAVKEFIERYKSATQATGLCRATKGQAKPPYPSISRKRVQARKACFATISKQRLLTV
jgi:hypothetical protein